jgi:ATP-dependent RNA helicase DeaD
VDELAEALQKRGYAAEGLHGDLSQNQRDNVMRKFRDGSIDVLVATDVAARGLDVSGVTHVINFDLPQDPESYVHRIGRTGRAGKEGTAWTFVTPREIDHLHLIEKVTRHKINKKPLPSIAEAIEGKQKMTAERIIDAMQADEYGEFKGVAIQLLEQYDSVNLIAAALKILTGDKKEVNIELTPEEPMRARKKKFDVRSSGRRVGGGYGSGGSSGGDRRNDRPSGYGSSSGSNSRYPRKDGSNYGPRDGSSGSSYRGNSSSDGRSSSSRERDYGSGNRDRSRTTNNS